MNNPNIQNINPQQQGFDLNNDRFLAFLEDVVRAGIQINTVTNYAQVVAGGRMFNTEQQEQQELQRALELSFNLGIDESQKHKRKVSDDEYAKLVKVRNAKQKDKKAENSCAICLEGYNTHRIAKLPCGHEFHNSCANKWFKKYGSDCPLCKKALVADN